jgi:hypothetical protein
MRRQGGQSYTEPYGSALTRRLRACKGIKRTLLPYSRELHERRPKLQKFFKDARKVMGPATIEVA